ncbi:MAG: regulatory iron-sulfur-containing complex subunit RicT, partial [Spirochaetes bacterium]|nr:regulatory iron-sulfur-containing complex subunit RicT [Spirochaetota bacterium]
MSDDRKDILIEDLERLEDLERNSSGHQGRQRESTAQEKLPETLYRLKILHSCESFFGYYESPKGEWPHFRTLNELEAILEGPFASSPEPIAESESEAASEAVLALESEIAEPQAAEEAPQPRFIPSRALVVAGRIDDKDLANSDEIVAIERPAGIDDLRRLKENAEKENKAFELCRDKIWARNLPMKLVSAHYLIDEPKILFYFAAESRVDFRELVKDLVSIFKTRIELRQIGVRDEARVIGGCGVCGRILCCHGISDRLNPVSIKMAKDQNLSLNSLKISGPCG